MKEITNLFFFLFYKGGEKNMPCQVIEYMDNNPQLSPKEIVRHFANELEVDQQLNYLQREVDVVLEKREVLRPLYAKKSEAEAELALLDSDFAFKVMDRYPPRKGSDTERKAYLKELQADDEDYQTNSSLVTEYKEKIKMLEEEMDSAQQRAKNARRILETFNHYMAFILEYNKSAVHR